MASGGYDNWSRNWQVDFKTFSKKEASYYESISGRSGSKKLKKGEEIFYSKNFYSQEELPNAGDSGVRVPFKFLDDNGNPAGKIYYSSVDNFEKFPPGKPGSGEKQKLSFKLKPQDFYGICGVKLQYSLYYRKLLSSISVRKDLPLSLKSYLIYLCKYAKEGSSASLSRLNRSYRKFINAYGGSGIKEIEKDFAEMLGPLMIPKMMPIQGIYGLENRTFVKVFIPSAGNYPLIDYIMYGTKKIKIRISLKTNRTGYLRRTTTNKFSAKTQNAKSNTIKPVDLEKYILELRKDSNNRSDVRLDVLNTLKSYSAKDGPFYAIKKHFNVRNFPPQFDATTLKKYQGTMEVLMTQAFTGDKSKVASKLNNSNGNNFVEICSYICQKWIASQNLDYADLIEDYVMSEVNYAKFALNNGIPNLIILNKWNVKTLTPGKKYLLDTKSDTSKPIREKMGIRV